MSKKGEKKNKKRVLIVLLIVALLIVVAAVSVFFFIKPYLKVIEVAKELKDKDFSYGIECYIEGITLGGGEYGKYKLYVEGEKIRDELRSYVYSDENAYLEIFANKKGDILFNLRPFFQYISNQAEEKLHINVGELVLDIEDTYISMKDIEEILDVNIVGPNDFGKNDSQTGDEEDSGQNKDDGDYKEHDKNNENNKKSEKLSFTDKYKIEIISEPDDIKVNYEAEKSYFFRLTLLQSGTKVIVGVPSSTNGEFYINMEKGDIRLEMYVEYEVDEDEEINRIDFPSATFTQEQIQNFKAVYKLWIAAKEVLDKLKTNE